MSNNFMFYILVTSISIRMLKTVLSIAHCNQRIKYILYVNIYMHVVKRSHYGYTISRNVKIK